MPILQSLCRTVLFKWCGWTERVDQPFPDKCIFCVAPHTSNFDFFIGKTFCSAKGWTANFLMKKEWFFWPLGPIFRYMGGIPVVRSKHTSMTDRLAETANRHDRFALAVTPEGTRKLTRQWKRGFYYIALKANLPILLYGIDFKKKEIVCTRTLIPSGDVESDMRTIMEYYRPFNAKHPEKFAVEEL